MPFTQVERVVKERGEEEEERAAINVYDLKKSFRLLHQDHRGVEDPGQVQRRILSLSPRREF